MSNKANGKQDPFQLATPTGKRAKIVLYGDSGTGKTLLALAMGAAVEGKVALIDLESGTDFYAEEYEFYRMQTTSLQQVNAALNFIRANQHDYGLLIVDPVTVLYNKLQRHYVGKNETVDPQGWNKIKAHMDQLYEDLLSLPIPTIIIAREATEYAETSGNKLTRVGVKPDSEKNGRYMFDATLQLWLRDAERVITVEKDRSNTLPKEIAEPGVADFVDLLAIGDAGAEQYQERLEAATSALEAAPEDEE